MANDGRMVGNRFLVMLATSSVLLATVSSRADSWRGHLTTLQEARIACRDTGSDDCLPYLAQAVAVADTLSAQADFSNSAKNNEKFQMPGVNGSTWICDPSAMRKLNGDSLLHLA